MVAFLRTLVAALPAVETDLNHVEAALAGKPLMDGPPIVSTQYKEQQSSNHLHPEDADSNNIIDKMVDTTIKDSTELRGSTPTASGSKGTSSSSLWGRTWKEVARATNTLRLNKRASKQSSKEETSFSLSDWALAFRLGARLASGRATNGSSALYNMTMTLTPSLQVDPPPYTMSTYGGGEDKMITAEDLHPTADFESGQLLLLVPKSGQNDLEEKIITTADWLVKDSDASISDTGEASLSITRDLKAYFLSVLTELEDTGDRESFHEKVDLAISLSARARLLGSLEEAGSQNGRHKTVRVRAYSPNYFAQLRKSFGVDESSYWESLLDEDSPFISFQSNSKGAKRVGGMFFFTEDGAYMIKTIKQDEVGAFLGSILPKYGPYMKKNGKSSLLGRFCGLYQVKIYDKQGKETVGKSRAQTFAVMNAVFPAKVEIKERFDLKGSLLGRKCSDDEIREKGHLAILKDLDLADEVEEIRSNNQRITSLADSSEKVVQKEGLHIGGLAKSRLMTQLKKDAELLASCNAIDYSLLVGVAPRESPLFDYLHNMLLATKGVEKFLFQEDSLFASEIRLLLGQSCVWRSSARYSDLFSAKCLYDSSFDLCGVDAGPLSRTMGQRRGVPGLFYFGVIDFLQPYNAKKAAEYQFKAMKYGNSPIYSCVPPSMYADRFLSFLERYIT